MEIILLLPEFTVSLMKRMGSVIFLRLLSHEQSKQTA